MNQITNQEESNKPTFENTIYNIIDFNKKEFKKCTFNNIGISFIWLHTKYPNFLELAFKNKNFYCSDNQLKYLLKSNNIEEILGYFYGQLINFETFIRGIWNVDPKKCTKLCHYLNKNKNFEHEFPPECNIIKPNYSYSSQIHREFIQQYREYLDIYRNPLFKYACEQTFSCIRVIQVWDTMVAQQAKLKNIMYAIYLIDKSIFEDLINILKKKHKDSLLSQ